MSSESETMGIAELRTQRARLTFLSPRLFRRRCTLRDLCESCRRLPRESGKSGRDYMLLNWTPITSHATVPRAITHLRAFVLLTAGDLGDLRDNDFLRVPLSLDPALFVAGAIARTLRVKDGSRGLFARGTEVSCRWRRRGTTRSILTFFLWCLGAGAALSVLLEAAASGVERGAAGVVAALSEAPAGLASLAGMWSNSGCLCVRDGVPCNYQPPRAICFSVARD